MKFHDDDLNPTSTQAALAVLRMLRPHRLEGAEKIRVGRMFDGGYVMVDRFEGITAAYSLGINDDISWDLEIAGRGIPIYQYDHTIAALPEENPLFHWEAKCISGVADPANNVESLETLITRNGYLGNRDLLLKCDIEGAEWYMLQKTPNTILSQFRQIVMEMHHFAFLSNPNDAENVRKSFANLMTSHRVVHVHANNHSPWQVVGGIPIPATLEFTFLRMDEGLLVPSDEVFPGPLDMPCRVGDADMYLGRFTFD